MATVVDSDDFLNVIRFLNENNINAHPKERDAFFESLLKNLHMSAEYEYALSDGFFNASLNDYDAKIYSREEIIHFCCSKASNTIMQSFLHGFFVDKGGSLFWGGSSSADPARVGSIKIVFEAVKECPRTFRMFKDDFLRGLIGFHAKEVFLSAGADERKLERLNKVILVYVESCKGLSLDSMPYILDEDFFADLCSRFTSSEKNSLTGEDCYSLALQVWFRRKSLFFSDDSKGKSSVFPKK